MFVRSFVALPLVGVLMRLTGLRQTLALVGRFTTPTLNKSSTDISAALTAAAEAVVRAANHLPLYRPACLPRSLVLWHLLRRQGLPAELRIGVRKANGDFTAHAWVEYDGQVINDAPDVAQRFAPVDLPASLAGTRW